MEKIFDFFSYEMILAITLFIAGHTAGWFAGNSQFVWDFWKDKALLATIIFGVPAGLLFWYGTKYCFIATGGELWSVRFIAAVFSYVTFPIMTWYFLGETIFTIKTMICIFLALMILLVQMYFG